MNLSALNKAVEGKTKTQGISPFSELEVTKVYPNPNQPRKSFENIEELAQSIKENGLIQPIAVVAKENGYMIVSGERRFRATLYAELKTIKAHILQVDDVKVQELSLIENIQREDLSDIEKAHFIAKLWESGLYAKKQDLAKAIGKSQSYISKALGVLSLDKEILDDNSIKDVGLEVLDTLRSVKDKELQKKLYKDKATVKEIRESKISSTKKFKRVMRLDANDTEKVIDYLSGLPLKKTYKITIEEV